MFLKNLMAGRQKAKIMNSTELFYILIYIIGAILSNMRLAASYYEYEENHQVSNKDASMMLILMLLMTISSWIGLIIGLVSYYRNNEKYFILRYKLHDRV